MDLTKKKCVPCEGMTDPLTESEENKYLAETPKWQIDRNGIHKISREYTLLHFRDSIAFVNQIAELSEDEGHHPNITILFNVVIIEIFTHAIKGLSENDFILAVKIDNIFDQEFNIK